MFFHPDGRASHHPVTLKDARRLRKPKYDSGIKCPDCNDCSIRFVINDKCIHCARLEAIDYYNHVCAGHPPKDLNAFMREGIAVLHDARPDLRIGPRSAQDAQRFGIPVWFSPDACQRYGHPGVRTVGGECWFCRKKADTPSARQAAIAAGEKWYTPADPCKRCGTRSKRSVHNGRCLGCDPTGATLSPRQAAIAAGKSWYVPEKPCKVCGTTAERHVENGRCRGCHPIRREPTNAAAEMALFGPDAIVPRQDAKAAGMAVYRTGKECKHGHTDWRYVSTGGCLSCLRGK